MKKKRILKTIGSTINKAAKKVSRYSGGGDLTEYMGAKIAKARAPKAQKQYIKSSATGKQAAASAGKVAGTIGYMAAGGAVGSAMKARKAVTAAKAAKSAGYNKLGAHGKRLVKWEQEARNAAAKRMKNKGGRRK